MNSIYITNTGKTQIAVQQGVIINGCLAENYACEVHGLIITPRCDIENHKVSTIHYLPIVSLEEWLQVDCLQLAITTFKHKLAQKLERLEISSSILDFFIDREDLQVLLKGKSEKPQIIKEYDAFCDVMCNHDYSSKFVADNYKNIFADLYSGRHNRFYLINNWEKPNMYNVILLRDVKRITEEFSRRLSKGCQNKMLEDKDYFGNDIYKSEEPYDYKTLAQISSPYIEHILQQFSHNFCRIGVEEHIDVDYLKKEYKLIPTNQ